MLEKYGEDSNKTLDIDFNFRTKLFVNFTADPKLTIYVWKTTPIKTKLKKKIRIVTDGSLEFGNIKFSKHQLIALEDFNLYIYNKQF